MSVQSRSFERMLVIGVLLIFVPLGTYGCFAAFQFLVLEPAHEASLRQNDKILAWNGNIGRAAGMPTQSKKALSRTLLAHWKKLSADEQRQNAPNLLVGNVFLGMTQTQVTEGLGSPSQPFTVMSEQLAFAIGMKREAHLILKFADGRCTDAFLHVDELF